MRAVEQDGSAASEARPPLEKCAVDFESLSSENEGVYYHADQLLKSLYVAEARTKHAFSHTCMHSVRAWTRALIVLQVCRLRTYVARCLWTSASALAARRGLLGGRNRHLGASH